MGTTKVISRDLPKAFTALAFWKLKSPDLPWHQWQFPSIITILVIATLAWIPKKPPVLGSAGLVDSVNALLSVLVGFYIAALAAVASFPNEALDREMKGACPTLTSKRAGAVVEERLTRRRFLCIVFGFCSFLAMAIYFMGVGTRILAPSVNWRGPLIFGWPFMELAWLLIYVAALSSLAVATLLGMHYLVERMHRD